MRSVKSPLALPGALLLAVCFVDVAVAEMTVNLGGRLQIDAAIYDEDITELGSGTEFRRARVEIEGDLDDKWSYKAQYEFADAGEIRDAFVEYGGLPAGSITVGNFKQPFSLEELTGPKYTTFMERALINEFAPSRRIGIGYANYDQPLGFAGALYGGTFEDTPQDEGVGAAGRFVFAPGLGEGMLLHLGLAALWQEADTTDIDTDVFRVRARPESHVTSARLVDTGELPGTNEIQSYGFEAACNVSSVSFQGEYIISSIDTDFGDFDFDGWYVYGSWFPGGEQRAYEGGAFQRTTAENAWELALRYSSLDLDDGSVLGGKQDDITLGINYYVSPYLRFMFNYVRADVEGGINGDEEVDLLQARVAFDFK